MSLRMKIICINGAQCEVGSGHKQVEDATDMPSLILCHNASLANPKVHHRPIFGDSSPRPLTKAAINMVENIGGLTFKAGTRPYWLPTELSQSVPPEHLAKKLYNDSCKSSIDSIVFISPTADCNDFVRGLLLISSLLQQSATTLKETLRGIGKICPPESWKKELEELFHKEFQESMQILAASFSDKGDIKALSPTGNGDKVNVVAKVLGQERDKIWVRNIESGVDNQPESCTMGGLGNFTRAMTVLAAYQQTAEASASRPGVFAIESFVEVGEEILKLLTSTAKPGLQVYGDFAVTTFYDAAKAELNLVIAKGTPGPKAVNDLRHLLGTEHTNGQLLAAIFPGENIDPKNWHKWVFPEADRYFDIIQDCMDDSKFKAAIHAWKERR